MKINIIGACSDMGVEVCGSEKGPKVLIDNLNNDKINEKIIIDKPDSIKSTDKNDLRKNLKEVNFVNEKIFNTVANTIKNNIFPITLGGDHSIAIASALASNSINKNLGIIWIDAHLDYNTFDTTITGNLHGLPLAAINGLCKDLTPFSNSFYNPKNTVIVGYRAKEENRQIEIDNVINAGGTIFSEEDIEKYGLDVVLEKAFSIALNNTNGVHISFDLDVINPTVAPGVSIPEVGGLSEEEAYKVMDTLIDHKEVIKSLDLVELNPLNDIDNKTYKIAMNLLNKYIEKK